MDTQQKLNTNSLDVSPFLLMEATGDSEATNMTDDSDHIAAAVADDDDAESCICDISDHSCVSDDLYVNGVDDVDDEEEGVHDHVYQSSWVVEEGGEVGYSPIMKQQKSYVSMDSISTNHHQPMNEMERNRLFWEACLAS